MRSVHNYINYKCNPNSKYSPMKSEYDRITYNGSYKKISVKIRKAEPVLRENFGYCFNNTQYWMGNA